MASTEDKELYVAPVILPPSVKELEDISNDLRLKCSTEELEAFKVLYSTDQFSSVAKAYQRVCQLPEEQLPVKYPRTPGYREQNDNSWYWRCDINGSDSGILAGKTIAIKDNVAVAGIPMMNGSKILEGYTPEFDATIITRILDAGGRIIGKAACEDLCCSGGSWTSSTGTVKNPHDPTRTTGGSSSGSASLVARGEVDMAIGGDQGGSVRSPASWCGIVGLKPTWGLVPYTGAMSMEITLDHLGPMTKTVEDCAMLLEAISGYDDGRDPRQPINLEVPEYSKLINGSISGKKIGILLEGFEEAEPDVCSLVKEAVNSLSFAGAIIEDVSIPLHSDGMAIFFPIAFEGDHNCIINGNGNGYSWKGYYPLSMQEAIARGINLRPHDLSVMSKLLFTSAEYVKRHYQNKFYAKSQNLSRVLSRSYDDALNTYDVLVMPTCPGKATKLPTNQNTIKEIINMSMGKMTNNAPFNVTGHPALTINTGFSENLPIGMAIVGRKFDEVTVLQVARAYEKIRDKQ